VDYLTYQYFASGFAAISAKLGTLETAIAATSTKLDRLSAQLGAVQAQGVTMTVKIADIQNQADKALAAIAVASSKDDSIIELVNQETALISALRQQLTDAIEAGGSPAALQAVLDAMIAAENSALHNADKVVDAINANTPPTPPE